MFSAQESMLLVNWSSSWLTVSRSTKPIVAAVCLLKTSPFHTFISPIDGGNLFEVIRFHVLFHPLNNGCTWTRCKLMQSNECSFVMCTREGNESANSFVYIGWQILKANQVLYHSLLLSMCVVIQLFPKNPIMKEPSPNLLLTSPAMPLHKSFVYLWNLWCSARSHASLSINWV